ncbi:hypothetical protein ACTXQV_73965, partial [Klebsiella pneumoniae]
HQQISPSLASSQRAALAAWLEEYPDHPSLHRVASPTEISEAYRHTALNSRMATIAAQLIGGSGTRFHHSKINSKLPHT